MHIVVIYIYFGGKKYDGFPFSRQVGADSAGTEVTRLAGHFVMCLFSSKREKGGGGEIQELKSPPYSLAVNDERSETIFEDVFLRVLKLYL